MWNDTLLTKRLGIGYPIVQGPFGGGSSSAKLLATVSNAGGLGSFGAGQMAPQQIKDVIAEIRTLTAKPFAINLWIAEEGGVAPTLTRDEFERSLNRLDPYYRELQIDRPSFPNQFGPRYDDQVEVLLECRPPVFSFVFGIPSQRVLQECRARGILTMGTATTVDEAVALERAGVDVVVATGFEAGGHRPSFLKPPEDCLTGTLALVPQIVDHVGIPVVAAGGIADARGVAAALSLGAHGAQIGTAFLACDESGASPAHRDRLFSAVAKDTVLTRVFSGRLARSLRNRFAEEMKRFEADLPTYPIQNWISGSLRTAALAQGRSDLLSQAAGQIAPLVKTKSAQTLFDDLIRETPAVLARTAGL